MIKMKPCEATLLGLSKEGSTTLHENEKKHAYSFRYNYSNRPVSLNCILALDIGKERRIKRLCARDSFMALFKNSPPVIWNILPDGRQFDNIGEFINKIPVFLLTREPRLNTLQDHAKMIEKFLLNGRNPSEIKNGKNI